MSSEKFCLKWNDFETNISAAFRDLREEKDFFDVTLACEDNQIEAHKVILSACSTFFRNILKRNPHQRPLLYLKGVKYRELLNILNFMYLGEVNVGQDELNTFLSIAEELKVKGLTQGSSDSQQGQTVRTPEGVLKPKNQAGINHEIAWGEPSKRVKRRQEEEDIQEVMQVKAEPKETMLLPQDTENTKMMDEQQDYEYEGYEDGTNIMDPSEAYTTGMDKGRSLSNSGSKEERPVISRVQVKKSLLKTIGNAKQCLLCNKVFSREKVAVGHVFHLHQDLLQSPDDILKQDNQLEEDPNPNTVEMRKSNIGADNSILKSPCWKCKFCSKLFVVQEDTVAHLRLMHGVTRLDARNRSLTRIS